MSDGAPVTVVTDHARLLDATGEHDWRDDGDQRRCMRCGVSETLQGGQWMGRDVTLLCSPATAKE